MREETILLQALKNEQARLETIKIIEEVRKMGGTDTILKLAGYILTTPRKAPDGDESAA